ncbi:purine/pyrimidine permease [Aquibacillus sediminis]|uniref:purine/pyrimidine permease n=1 Tax=Aquibacillus sediminis TaxID=2574734 RepID=UPI001FE6CAA3|nr:purine/pyrimidine permease [Aquibacillus sediminis]
MNNQQHSITQTAMETVQWFIFFLATTVAMPIVIGAIFELSFIEISGLMQRTLFVAGVATLLQGVLGHRLPIMEGPAGIWISIFSVMAITGVQSGISLTESLQQLEATMILTGAFLLLFGVFKIAAKILPIFTPLVIGTFFLLLTVQLSGTFLQGMLGLQQGVESIQLAEAIIAFATFFIVLGLSTFARGWLSNYAVLIGIVIGWMVFALVVGNQAVTNQASLFSVPEVFAFGMPDFDISLIPIAFVTAIILLSNIVASIVAISQILNGKADYDHGQVNRGSAFSGINHGLAGGFAAVANVPLATSAGFIGLTGQKRKAPFIYASIVLILVSLFPPLVQFVAAIPAPVANAALLATFVQLVGLALRNVSYDGLDSQKVMIIGISYLIGMGTMFLPPEVFIDLPTIVQNFASNGLLVGTTLVIALEQMWKLKDKKDYNQHSKQKSSA